MEIPWVTIALIALVVIYLASTSVKVVPVGHAFVVERLGRYRTALEPGLHLIVPSVDRVAHRMDMGEQVFSRAREQVITRDSYVVLVDLSVFFQIVDPRAAAYQTTDYARALDTLTVESLRDLVGSMNLDEVVLSGDVVGAHVRTSLSQSAHNWGIRVHRVQVTAIDPPNSTYGSGG